MIFDDVTWIRIALGLSFVIYFVHEWRERRRVLDEREELIQLKTYELVNKITTATLAALAFGYFIEPSMSAIIPLAAIVIATLYTEMLGKAWFRYRL